MKDYKIGTSSNKGITLKSYHGVEQSLYPLIYHIISQTKLGLKISQQILTRSLSDVAECSGN